MPDYAAIKLHGVNTQPTHETTMSVVPYRVRTEIIERQRADMLIHIATYTNNPAQLLNANHNRT